MCEDKIKAKLVEIAKQKEQTIANLNALVGAENVLKQLIDSFESEGNADADNSTD